MDDSAHDLVSSAAPEVVAETSADAVRAAGPTLTERRLALGIHPVVTLLLLVLLAAALPDAVARSRQKDGLVYVGMMWAPHDTAQYTAAMYEGASGASWLVHDHLSAEPHRVVFMYAPYVALGKLFASLGLDAASAWRPAVQAGRLALLLAIWWICHVVLRTRQRVALAVVFVVLSAGLGMWLMLVVGDLGGVGPADLNLPEYNTLLTLFGPPHLTLSLALLLVGIGNYTRLWDGNKSSSAPKAMAVAAGTSLGIGLLNPFALVNLGLPMMLHAAVRGWHRRNRGALLTAAATAVASCPFVAYQYFCFLNDPFWGQAYGSGNSLPSPAPWVAVAGLGLPLAMGVVGAGWAIRTRDEVWSAVAMWAAVLAVAMYAPVSFQRRFGFGLQPLLGLLAVQGLAVAAPWARVRLHLTRRTQWMVVRAAAALLLFQTNAFLYAVLYVTAARSANDAAGMAALPFWPESVNAAGEWLSNTLQTGDVVLAEAGTGNCIAHWGRGQVYVGHPIATIDYSSKREQARWFMEGQGTGAEREEFLRRNGIDYVVCGPEERDLDTDWLATAPYLELLYDRSGVQVYRVTDG